MMQQLKQELEGGVIKYFATVPMYCMYSTMYLGGFRDDATDKTRTREGGGVIKYINTHTVVNGWIFEWTNKIQRDLYVQSKNMEYIFEIEKIVESLSLIVIA